MNRFPPWLKRHIPPIGKSLKVANLLKNQSIHTVCSNARCPNLLECFSKGTATFLILGDICSRTCHFCAVNKGDPKPIDQNEPERIANVVQKLSIKHIVITSVTRDDLPDGGSMQFVKTIEAVRKLKPNATIEVLTPDFQGNESSLRQVLDAKPDIFNHNLETVPRLYPEVRPQADYTRSLNLLKSARQIAPKIFTKSGMMLGLGEETDEVINVLKDLRNVGCDILTLGQYLKPRRGKECLDVVRFIPPEEFDNYKETACKLGFKSVASAPYVRSSYSAAELFADKK